MATSPAFADSPFRQSVDRAVAASAQAPRSTAMRGPNPYMLPGLALLGGGVTLFAMAFALPTGAECTDKSTSTRVSVECGTKANKGLMVAGLAAAAGGGYLLMKGEKQRSAPSVSFAPGRVVVRQRFRF